MFNTQGLNRDGALRGKGKDRVATQGVSLVFGEERVRSEGKALPGGMYPTELLRNY